MAFIFNSLGARIDLLGKPTVSQEKLSSIHQSVIPVVSQVVLHYCKLRCVYLFSVFMNVFSQNYKSNNYAQCTGSSIVFEIFEQAHHILDVQILICRSKSKY